MDFTISYYVFVILIFCILGTYNWCRRKLYALADQLPGPVALPIIGNALQLIWKKEEVLNGIIKLLAPYSSPTRVWIGPRLVLFIKDPDQAQTILQSSKATTKAFIYRYLEPFLGKGLITSSGSVHKNHRKLLLPLFSQKMIEARYSHSFEKHAKKFVERIRKHVDGLEFDILPNLHNESFESAFELFMDEKVDSHDYKHLIHFIDRFYTIVALRVNSFWLHFDFIFEKTSYFEEISVMKETVHNLTEKIFAKKKLDFRKLKSSQNIPENKEVRIPSMLEAINEMMLEDPNCLSIKELSDHLVTFIITNLDTQGTTISFLCMMLGAYPNIQNQVVKELKEVLGNRTTVDLTDVSKLKYLEMCIKETMRLFPVVPFLIRDSIESFQLGYLTIPKNVTLFSSVYHLHRDPNSWEKPNEFYPAHFRPEATNKRHPCAFIPFSSGTRKCIAQQYSYANMKIITATMLLHYELECAYKVEDIRLTVDISVRPVDGYFVKIKRRIF